jgi:hypothetical protein
MFEEGSLPIQVANTLGLREKEISELYSGGISVVCMNYTRSNKS